MSTFHAHAHAGADSALYLDDLARGSSTIHGLDARAKLVPTLAAIIVAATIEPSSAWKLVALALLVLAASRAARTPVRFLTRRVFTLLPFAAFFAFTAPFLPGTPLENAARAGLIVAKAATSLLAATALAAATPWHDLLHGLTQLGVPRALTLVLHFVHRYVFVLWEEVTTLRRARDARLCGPLPLRASLVSSGGMLGALFLRSLERAERVEAAMAARGFGGGEWLVLGTRSFALRDAAALGTGLLAVLAIAVA
jgi:cobalt/nickel transport system permease protein